MNIGVFREQEHIKKKIKSAFMMILTGLMDIQVGCMEPKRNYFLLYILIKYIYTLYNYK